VGGLAGWFYLVGWVGWYVGCVYLEMCKTLKIQRWSMLPGTRRGLQTLYEEGNAGLCASGRGGAGEAGCYRLTKGEVTKPEMLSIISLQFHYESQLM